ncbi:MAG: NAD(P)H-hydrate dehydratase [Gammaproteobacteria bacterium]
MNPGSQPRDACPLYRAEQTRALDRHAIEEAGIPGYTLMTRAATAAWTALQAHWPAARGLMVLCGRGNNGGDGLVLARLAHQAGCQVRVLQPDEPGRIAGDAATARADWLAAGGDIEPLTARTDYTADVIVDALLGTGFSGALSGQWRAVVDAANLASAPIVALDIPSGLLADSGHVEGGVIRADLTVTFIGRKPGLYTGEGPACCGEIVFDDLGVPEDVYRQVAPCAMLDDGHRPNPFGRRRSRTAHKGDFGHVLIVGGDHGMIGAARLAGEAALRSGAGRVSLATRSAHAASLAAACPELMCHGVETALELKRLLAIASVVVAGPGLGQSAWARDLLSAVLESPLPQVLDADALTLLAGEPLARGHWILTPHPGEAARLLGCPVAAIQQDRLTAAQTLQARWAGTVVLKGAGTVVCADAALPVICSTGNPGMATAGSGDVLSGITGALVAQGLSLADAARAAVTLHGAAGDCASRQGERGRLARDLIAELPGLLKD